MVKYFTPKSSTQKQEFIFGLVCPKSSFEEYWIIDMWLRLINKLIVSNEYGHYMTVISTVKRDLKLLTWKKNGNIRNYSLSNYSMFALFFMRDEIYIKL